MPDPEMGSRGLGRGARPLYAVALIVVAGALAYSNSLDVPFVFDDEPGIERNTALRITALDPAQLYRAGVSEPSPRRPVANVSFALNYYAGGLDVRGFHVANTLVHLANGMLVFLLMLVTLGRARELPDQRLPHLDGAAIPAVALVAALVFVTHPVQTQAVTFVVQRMTSLASGFCLSSLLLYAWARARPSGWARHLAFAGALAAWLLALGSKEIAAAFPLVVLLWEWFFLQDLETDWIRAHAGLLGLLVACLAFVVWLFVGASPLERILATYEARDFTLGERVLTQLRVVPFYVSLILLPLPSRLNLLHAFTTSRSLVDPISTLFGLMALLATLAFAVRAAGRQRVVSFLVLWFVVGLALESSVIGLEMVYEHRLYLPLVGFAGLAACLLFHLCRGRERLALALSSVLILALGAGTWLRNATWRDEVVFWSDVVSKNPHSHRGHVNLGIALKERGRPDAAESHYREALRVKPAYEVAHNNLGNALRDRGEVDAAIEHYAAAIRSKPDYLSAHYNLGRALLAQGRLEDAAERFAEIVRVKPDHAEARYALGSTLLHLERLDAATRQLALAVELAPASGDAHYDLGIALAKGGRCAEALPHFEAALRIDPTDRQALAARDECARRAAGSPLKNLRGAR